MSGAAKCAAALSTDSDTLAAAREVCERAKAALGGEVHLAIVFASIDHRLKFAALAETLQQSLGTTCLLGCTGESIACGGREVEGTSALAVWVAHLPGVHLHPMHLQFQRTPEGGAILGWPDDLPDTWPDGASLIVLAEPFTFPGDVLLEQLNQDQPQALVVGGMASGGHGPDENRLILGGSEVVKGAVAVLMHGPIRMRSVVSQGCRPIGHHFVVTKAQQNVILELGGKSALAQLQELFGTLTPEEQTLARGGLHVGQVINEYQDTFGRGDFLVRNVQGVDPDNGAIAIGDYVRVGQTVQFHVRDAATADEELHELLSAARNTMPNCLGALLFTCNGRGMRLFDQPHHDAATVQKYWNDVPLAGFFAQGEIGPIGGKSFLHGFTASIALLEAIKE